LSPKTPRNVFGTDLAKVLCNRFGYQIRTQTGSHIIVVPAGDESKHIAIPAHKPLKVGTLTAIIRAFEAQTGQSRDELLKLL
jgi:predicted RNA binding protein YcfA (HicA-like mRNA interferase family)